MDPIDTTGAAACGSELVLAAILGRKGRATTCGGGGGGNGTAEGRFGTLGAKAAAGIVASTFNGCGDNSHGDISSEPS